MMDTYPPTHTAGIKYTPPIKRCWPTGYDASGNPTGYDPHAFGTCPSWTITGEDGTTITVYRESGEVNGTAKSRDGSTRYGWDQGAMVNGQMEFTPMGPCDWQPVDRRATPGDLLVMNKLLRPLALERPWEDLLKEIPPCDHSDRGCEMVNPRT